MRPIAGLAHRDERSAPGAAVAWAALKIAASAGILAFLGWRARTDIDSLRQLTLQVPLLIGALLALMLAAACNALRWTLVSRAMGLALGFVAATRLTFAALFASQVMPGMVGFDVMRGAGACWIGLPTQKVVTSVLCDRLISLAGLVLLASSSIPVMTGRVGGDAALLFGLVLAALLAALLFLVFADRIPLLASLAGRWRAVPIEMLRDVRLALASLSGIAAVGLAVAVQLLSVSALILLARGIGIDAAFEDGLIVLPGALLLASLPISINGWGVREGAIVFGFGLLGIDAPGVFTVSVLFGLWIILSSLPGAVLWWSMRRPAPARRGDPAAGAL
jgi:hypothetical protein